MKQRIWILLPLLLACAGFFRCGGGGAGSALADGKTWSPPERISDNVTELHYPAVAVDNQGNAVAAWARGPLAVILANRYSAAQDLWEGQEPIGTASPSGAWEPSLSVDSLGRTLAVWYQMESSVNGYSRRFLPSSGWDSGILSFESGSGDAYFPQVSLNGAGDGMAIWRQDGAILASRYDGSAGAWAAPETISSPPAGAAELPSMPGRGSCVRFDDSGIAYAAWMQSDGGGTHIWGSRFDGSSWGATVRIDPDSGNSDDPTLAVDGSGDAVHVWSQFGGAGTRSLLWVRRYRSAPPGGWDPPVLLDNVAGRVDKPQVVADGGGSLIVVWRRQEDQPGPKALFGARFSHGGGWGKPTRLSGVGLPDSPLWPALSMDPGGNAVVAWQQPETEGAPPRVWTRRFHVGIGWGNPAPVSLVALADAEEPAVGMDGNGNAILVWKQKDIAGTSVQSIWASRLR